MDLPVNLGPSFVMAEVASAMYDLAAHEGALMRLGLSLKFSAGAFEMTGQAQQEALKEILDAVQRARNEALLNPNH